jgi:hypothetical protein
MKKWPFIRKTSGFHFFILVSYLVFRGSLYIADWIRLLERKGDGQKNLENHRTLAAGVA